MHINKGVSLVQMSDFIMTLKWGHTWLTFRNLLRWHASLLTNQSWIEHPWVNKNLHRCESINRPWAQPENWNSRDLWWLRALHRLQGQETDLAFYCMWVKLPLLFYSLEWRSFTPNTTILHSKLSRVIIKVTGNVELPGSWLNFGWLGRRASSVCKGCGFLNDHPGLGLQTLPITKPRERVWPLLEVSRSVHKVLELYKTHSHS